MARKTAPLLPPTAELLRHLGERLHLARRRRRLTAKQVAERAGMSPMTLRSLERGGSGVTMGAFLAVMQVLGIEGDLDLLAQADTLGRDLQDARLQARTRMTQRTKLPVARNQRTPTRRSPAQDRAAQLHSPTGNSAREQPHTAIEGSTAEQRLGGFESLSGEHVRTVLDSLSAEQMSKALLSLPGEQTRKALESVSGEQMGKALEGASDWIERGGFASSEALARLIDPNRRR